MAKMERKGSCSLMVIRSQKTQQNMAGSIGDALVIANLGLFQSCLYFPVCGSLINSSPNDFSCRCRASARSSINDERLKHLKILSAEHSHEIPE